MKLQDFRNKKILILGYGKEGRATEQYLKTKIPDIEIGIADKSLDPDYLQKQNDYDLAIKTPGIQKSVVTIPYTTATNIFFANVDAVTIGVTGSKGKSTTASLIAHILKKAGKKVHLVGNIGNPMLSELLKSYTSDDIFVCELSSYQCEDLHYSPHISVITSLFPEHMNYHGSVASYYNAKRNIIVHASEHDYFIYNPKYKLLSEWAHEAKCKSLPFKIFSSSDHKLLGAHNKENINGAYTVASLMDIPPDIIQSAISSFKPLPHRLEYVGAFRGILFYDDAISTAPESAIAAIETLENIGTIILGGEDRGFDFQSLVHLLSKRTIPNIVLFPKSGEKIKELILKTPYNPTILETSSMEHAVKFAYENTPAGSICILSTASPSYTIWKNFEEKGNEFQKYVIMFSQ